MSLGPSTLIAAPLIAQAPEASIAWLGDPPRQGAFALVEVRAGGDPPVMVEGTVRGVPLRFELVEPGRFVALTGVAFDAADSVLFATRLEYRDGRVAARDAYLPVTAGQFLRERLSVAPQFTRRPDSALAARIARENAAAREVSRDALQTPRLWREAFRPPRESRITSAYGTGRVFNGQVQSRHWGVDFDGVIGAPVRAAGRGVVALVGDFYYAGSVIYLNHGAGVVTAYLHLSETLVAPGDTVTAGQRIGSVGQSGRVTGPHLHWAAKYGTASLDGTTLLALPGIDALRDRTP